MNTENSAQLPSLGSVFKLVFSGWAVGVFVLAGIPFLFALIFTLLTGGPDLSNMLLGLLIIPFVALGQGLFAGCIVCLGLTVLRLFSKKA